MAMRGRTFVAGCVALLVVSCAPPGLALPTQNPESEGAATAAPSTSLSAGRPADPSAPASPPPSPAFVPRTATINVSGDLLWHNSLWSSAELDAAESGARTFDFGPQLAALRDYVSSADLAICHSEVPFAEADGPYSNYPMFKVPQEIAPAVADTGWDLCTTASNHTMDAGWDGLTRTIAVYKEAGVLTAGTYATKKAAKTPVIFTTDDGVKVAVISQTFGLNGLSKAKDKPWSVELLDADLAVAQARTAKEAGADIVAVHMHAGDEYSSSLNSQQRAFAETVTASPDVDLVFGQHAHVVQPIDRVNGKWVVYGSGNLIAASGPAQPRTYDGFMAQITFTELEDGGFEATAAEFAPTFITKKSGSTPARVYLIADALAAGTGPAADMKASAERTRETVRALGVHGLTERQ